MLFSIWYGAVQSMEITSFFLINVHCLNIYESACAESALSMTCLRAQSLENCATYFWVRHDLVQKQN